MYSSGLSAAARMQDHLVAGAFPPRACFCAPEGFLAVVPLQIAIALPKLRRLELLASDFRLIENPGVLLGLFLRPADRVS